MLMKIVYDHDIQHRLRFARILLALEVFLAQVRDADLFPS